MFSRFLFHRDPKKELTRVESGMYWGEMEKSLPDGFGVLYGDNGTIYMGGWENGNMNGYGVRYREDMLLIYAGNFKDGLPHGWGATCNHEQLKAGYFQSGVMTELDDSAVKDYGDALEVETDIYKIRLGKGNDYTAKASLIDLNAIEWIDFMGRYNDYGRLHGKGGIYYLRDANHSHFEGTWHKGVLRGDCSLKTGDKLYEFTVKDGVLEKGPVNIYDLNEETITKFYGKLNMETLELYGERCKMETKYPDKTSVISFGSMANDKLIGDSTCLKKDSEGVVREKHEGNFTEGKRDGRFLSREYNQQGQEIEKRLDVWDMGAIVSRQKMSNSNPSTMLPQRNSAAALKELNTREKAEARLL